MDEPDKMMIRRRGFLGILTTGGLTAVAVTVPLGDGAVADTESYDEKRKPRYRVSEEVKTFYRVNAYPARRDR